MTRINTNISSLTAQTRLSRTNKELQTSLTRLSTGLRINTGADDPAGLIASEALRSDITGINKALSNTTRAGQIIATADSALSQVSNLLNDIRGLVVEASNTGALSDDEIAANQLQVDSSLEAINRIAQTTTFQGRKLLDGSLDFLTKAGTGFTSVADLQIDQANLGATGSISVNVNISAAASKASISNTTIDATVTPVKSTGTITFGTPDPDTEATIQVDLAASYATGAEAARTVAFANSFTPANEASATNVTLGSSGMQLNIAARDGGAADGAKGNATRLKISTVANGNTSTASYDADNDLLTITLEEGVNQATIVADLAATTVGTNTFNFTAGTAAGTNTVAADANVVPASGLFTGGTNTTGGAQFELTALDGGAADGAKGNSTTIRLTSGTTTGATYDADTNQITVTAAANATIAQIAAAINTDLSNDFMATDLVNGTYKYSNADNTTALSGSFTGGTNSVQAGRFQLEAVNGQGADGTKANSTAVVFASGSSTAATYDAALNQLQVTVATGATVDDIISAINTDGTFAYVANSKLNGTATFGAGDIGTNTPTVITPGTDNSDDDVITVTAKTASADFDKTITFATDNSYADGVATAAVDNNGNIIVTTKNSGNVNLSAIRDAINTLDDFEATISATAGDGVYTVGTDAAPTIVDPTGGTAGGGLADDLVFTLTGSNGAETFQFAKGATIENIIQSVNLVKDATGIEAENDGGNLKLSSTTYGSKSVAAIEVISEGAQGTFKSGLTATRATGSDIVAKVNGYTATGDGNTLSINTATLDMKMTVNAGSSTSVNFDITGGGALFQLGGDVVSNQQARLGIGSLSTGKLGGVEGRLYELGSGQSKALATDATGAGKVIDEVINKVTGIRGRLGAFQRTTLESNTVSLTDTVTNLQDAESSIRDADFAAESAKLTRAQILVQSGTSVLGIANQNPQNVLSLLR